LIKDTVDRMPVIEPLYYSASLEHSSQNYIVKVVNVQDISVSAQVVLEDLSKDSAAVQVFEMSGFSLDDENSFESPMRVAPKKGSLSAGRNGFPYVFPKHSVTVFRVT
jgi:alpha-L-arabinofuranosidase